MRKLCVNLNTPYDILIDSGLINNVGKLVKNTISAKTICLISDTNVYPIYGENVKKSLQSVGYQVYEYIFEAGEQSKTTSNAIAMVEFMADKGLTRSDAVVTLGGGVCGDMGGFAAAMYLRGIDFVQIPTSLLAQIDSSVGGKTAVDLPQGKNLCGAFHQPRLVIIDPNVLDTLKPHFFSDGMGEAIKAGCIKSSTLFDRIEKEDAKDFIEDMIFECVDIKRKVVENDEKEHGERALLNFGHTAGHAIEKLWNFKSVSHGEAVGIGMVIIAKAGEDKGITKKGTSKRIENVLLKYNLKTADTHSLDEIVGAMSADKKRTGTGIKLALLNDIGDSFISLTPYEKINDFFGVKNEYSRN